MENKKTSLSESDLMGQQNAKVNANTKRAERIKLLKSRLSVAKHFCKKPHAAWKAWTDEYNIEDFGDTEVVRDKVRIGYVFRKAESDMPSMFDDKPDIFIEGRSAPVKDIAPVIYGLNDYLWDIQNLEDKIDDGGLYFIVLGMGVFTSPWVTKTKKVPQTSTDPTTGKETTTYYDVPVYDAPNAIAENPFKVYFSPETQFGPVMDSEHCPYYFKEKTLSPDEIKAKWNKKVKSSDMMNIDDGGPDVNIDLAEDKSIVKEDVKRNTVYEYWGTLPEENAPTGKDSNGNPFSPWQYDTEYHIEMTNSQELFIEECPYDHKPLFILGNYGFANKFWKFGDTKHLMPLVQEFQQYRSHLLEYARKMTDPKVMIPAEADVDEDAFSDTKIGRPVKYTGDKAPSYLSPSPMGKEVEEGIGNVRQDLEKTAGSFDLTGGGGQSSVKTPRGIAVYSEAADKNVARKRKKISKLIRELTLFQFKQVAEMWTPEDNKTIPVKDNGIPTALGVTADILKVIGGIGQMYTINIEVETLSINRVQQKRDALDLWDLAEPHPEIFNLVEMAKDLLINGYGKKNADRYLTTAEEKAKMQANAGTPTPKVAVQIKADAATPVGDQLLMQEGLLPANAPTDVTGGAAAVATDPNAMPQELAGAAPARAPANGNLPTLPPELQAMMGGGAPALPAQ